MKTNLKYPVFFVPFALLVLSMVYSLADTTAFLSAVTSANNWILQHFGWLFSAGTFSFLILCVWVYFSPLAKVRIGGPQALPLVRRWEWFSITLCTTIAIGILFWATAEPLHHLHAPPAGAHVTAGSDEAARFAMSTMYLHWTFTPYSIYTIAGLMFALAYYNLRQPFSLGSMLTPLFGYREPKRLGNWIDIICLYSLVAGMAASLGAGILTISGGLQKYAGTANTPAMLMWITLAVVVSFVVSSITGLTKGIRLLSNINTYAFFAIALFALFLGPTRFLCSFGAEGLVSYIRHFIPRSLGIGMDSAWAGSWTVFYWANWLAWTPVTAVFLGRLALGYTVRDFIHFNLVLPSAFSILWMMIFSGNAIHIDHVAHLTDLYGILQSQGPEGVIYAVLDQLPLAGVSGIFFFATAFLSYVAGADANASAMGGLCTEGISPESPEPPAWIKIAWGSIVGLVAWVMVANAGIDGIKMASTLGGFPALFLILAVAIGLIRLLRDPKRIENR